MEEFNIPDKLYFRIGEVAKLIGVEPYVLRYWETEFPDIAPTKSRSKQRLYKRQDVEMIYKIRELLYKQNYTIKGAKRKIKEKVAVHTPQKIEHKKASDKPVQLEFEASKETTKYSTNVVKDVVDEMDTYLKG